MDSADMFRKGSVLSFDDADKTQGLITDIDQLVEVITGDEDRTEGFQFIKIVVNLHFSLAMQDHDPVFVGMLVKERFFTHRHVEIANDEIRRAVFRPDKDVFHHAVNVIGVDLKRLDAVPKVIVLGKVALKVMDLTHRICSPVFFVTPIIITPLN